jgi:hypothetical protein
LETWKEVEVVGVCGLTAGGAASVLAEGTTEVGRLVEGWTVVLCLLEGGTTTGPSMISMVGSFCIALGIDRLAPGGGESRMITLGSFCKLPDGKEGCIGCVGDGGGVSSK